jgi:CheY-like chemotaxis protein
VDIDELESRVDRHAGGFSVVSSSGMNELDCRDEVIRENYTELLTDAGFDVAAYSNREDALEGITSFQPDLALLDITLGGERDAGYQ